MEKEYKGINGTIILTDKVVIIKRGIKGFLLGGGMLRGDKTIPYSSIIAVQFKKAGMMGGYIQLTLVGGSEAKGGLFQSTTDENSVNFRSSGDNEKFEDCKKLIEGRMGRKDGDTASHADELTKFAELRDNGVITEEEFNQKKKQLLNL